MFKQVYKELISFLLLLEEHCGPSCVIFFVPCHVMNAGWREEKNFTSHNRESLQLLTLHSKERKTVSVRFTREREIECEREIICYTVLFFLRRRLSLTLL